MPVEVRTRIGLAPRGDVAVTRQRFDRVAAPQLREQPIEGQVLSVLEGQLVAALELDADREVVAVRPPHPIRCAGMPCAPRARYELDQCSITADEEMRRNAQVLYLAEVGMGVRIQAIGKQVDDSGSAEFTGWQADGVDHRQSHHLVRGPLITVRRRDPPHPGQPTRVASPRHSFIPNRAIR